MNYAGILFKQASDFPFPGFVDRPFGAVYERAIAKVIGLADDINGKLNSQRLRIAIAYDRPTALLTVKPSEIIIPRPEPAAGMTA